MDQLSDLIGLILALVGKFWFVIIGYIGYKLLGVLGKLGQQTAKPRRHVLTPVQGGGYSRPAEDNVGQEFAEYGEVTRTTNEASSVRISDGVASVRPDMRQAKTRTEVDLVPDEEDWNATSEAMEGMKWALIFSPPRAKAPYVPPYLSSRKP